MLNENAPRIYVGTYGKYNNGDLTGQWLDLEDYSDYQEFLEAATEIHSDEDDPELMFQDYEDYKSLGEYFGESSIDEDYWDFLSETSDWDEEKFELFASWKSEGYGDSIEDFEESYQGEYGTMKDFAQHLFDEDIFTPDVRDFYISDTDRRIIAGEESDNRVDNMDDRDILSASDYEEIYDDIETDITDYEDDEDFDLDGFDSIEDYLDDKYGYSDLEEVVEAGKEKLRDEIYYEIYDALDDPYTYFVEEQGYSEEDFKNASFVNVDWESAASDLEYDYNIIDGHVFRSI